MERGNEAGLVTGVQSKVESGRVLHEWKKSGIEWVNGKDLYTGVIGDEMQMGPQVIDNGMEMVDRQSGAEAGSGKLLARSRWSEV